MNRPVSFRKPGRDVTVGDILPVGPGGFQVLGFAVYEPATGGAGRLALNAWGEAIVVFDAQPTAVLGRAT